MPGTLFEELGFNYIGPVDGHDVLGLITTLKNMRDLKGPQFLHIMTKKGRGYEPAEKDPITFHAVPKFDPSSGCLPKSSGGLPSYSKIFGDWLCETAAKDNKLMAITPAMREGSGMVEFSRKFPIVLRRGNRRATRGDLAAGLAIGGYKPIVAIYSTFLQRAYDQVCMTWRFKSFRSCSPSTVRALLVLTVKPIRVLLISLTCAAYRKWSL
ncbi:1-deoxy-D-xylulose-5-phosphate synthase [Escherichia coli]|uniref:1-deoxy-D-xylulose-5-phosphate synthase n=1 Tax=Escherichia coli TaxID=562 RepID=A0A377E7S7_ECOLX|nr:1-deoxy-D-xylulose-5-phosphate synthase [Escherichia coli]